MSDLIANGYTKIVLISLRAPVLEQADRQAGPPFRDFWNICAFRDTNLNRVVPAFAGLVAQ